MYTPLSDSGGRERLMIEAGAATVGRPKGVDGKKMSPRRARMTSKEVENIKTKSGVVDGHKLMNNFKKNFEKGMKAGGPGSGRHPLGSYEQRLKKAQQIIEQEKGSSKSKTHSFHNYQDKTKNGVSLKVGWERKSSQWEPREKVSPKAHKQLSQLADKVKPSISDMTDNTRYIFNKD